MERTEEFNVDGKSFVYLDLTGLRTSDEFMSAIEAIKKVIAKYPLNSLYTITNVDDARFDSETKAFLVDYMAHNKPYVKYGAVIGFNGINKMMGNYIFKTAERTNMHFAFTREKAMEWLMSRE